MENESFLDKIKKMFNQAEKFKEICSYIVIAIVILIIIRFLLPVLHLVIGIIVITGIFKYHKDIIRWSKEYLNAEKNRK